MSQEDLKEDLKEVERNTSNISIKITEEEDHNKHYTQPNPGTPSASRSVVSETHESDLDMDMLNKDKDYRPGEFQKIKHDDPRFEVTIDRYGFPLEGQINDEEHRKLLRQENARLTKWQKMLFPNKQGQMHTLSGVDVAKAQLLQWQGVKNHRKLKSRIRKGIPQALRSTVWQNLCGARERKLSECENQHNNNFYQDLVRQNKSPYHEQLWKDINRTYRKQVRFNTDQIEQELQSASSSSKTVTSTSTSTSTSKSKSSSTSNNSKNSTQPKQLYKPEDLQESHTDAQKQLYNVLKAFSLYREDIGYCQGMQSVVALMLMHMTEEESFWVLASLADDSRYQMENLWRPSMPAIKLRFYQLERLVKIFLPKLSKHFENNDITSAGMYQASQWFITVFLATSIPFHIILRIWDIYLQEGLKTIFRMGLGYLKYFENQLLASPFEDMMELIRDGGNKLNVDQYIKICFSINVTHGQLAELEKQFYKLEHSNH